MLYQVAKSTSPVWGRWKMLWKVRSDGVYGRETEESVRTFQSIFHLPQTGEVDFATWYSISNISVAVAKLA